MSDVYPIIWSDDLETGHPEIDAQHRTLVESLNRLGAAIAEGRGEEELGWCLSFLKAYTRVHFRTEEACLQALGGPRTAEHIAEHRALLEEVDGLFRRFITGDLGSLPETASMLDRWLVTHILETDREGLRPLREARTGG